MFRSSPLLPSKVSELLKGYEEIAASNAKRLGETFNACSRELEEKMHMEQLEEEETFWIKDRCLKALELHRFQDKAIEIVTEIRKYYNVDNLTF